MNNFTTRCITIISIVCLFYVSETSAQPPPPPLVEISFTDSVSPATDLVIAFGNISIGNSSDQTITISSIAKLDLNIFQIASDDPLSTPFSILSHSCSNITLSIAESCTLTVRFEPVSTGLSDDHFDINSNDADEGTVTITVNGTGSGIPVPDITVTDPIAPTLDLDVPFGQVSTGSQSDKIITIRNTGNSNLQISGIAQANPLAAPFSISGVNNTCLNNPVAPTGTCTFNVKFNPTAAGSVSDTFDIASNDPDEDTVTVTISGFGIITPVPDITVTDTMGDSSDLNISFGKKAINTSQDAIITVTNNGSATLVISGVATDNVLESPFIIQNDSCTSASLTPAEFCTFTVNFSPSTLSIWNDSFDIVSDDPDESTVSIAVNGRTNDQPVSPVLVFPQKNMTGVALTSEFTWEKSTDPDNDSISYTLTICEDNSFTSGCIPQNNITLATSQTIYYAGFGTGFMFIGVVFVGNIRDKRKFALLLVVLITCALFLASCGGGGSSDPANSGNNITRTVSGLKSGTAYYWKVTADDGKGGLSGSSVWSFTTQ